MLLVSVELELEELDGVRGVVAGAGVAELDEEDDGVLLEPAPAAQLWLEELEGAGVVLDEDEDEPPLAWSFLVFRSIVVDEELELGGVAVVPPADDEDEEPGCVVAPEGAVVEDELEERSAARSHAVISVAPSAIETATAIGESLMGPPWLGYRK